MCIRDSPKGSVPPAAHDIAAAGSCTDTDPRTKCRTSEDTHATPVTVCKAVSHRTRRTSGFNEDVSFDGLFRITADTRRVSRQDQFLDDSILHISIVKRLCIAAAGFAGMPDAADPAITIAATACPAPGFLQHHIYLSLIHI